jgi:pimeloyl-ACP methyl ester carboxylesterase
MTATSTGRRGFGRAGDYRITARLLDRTPGPRLEWVEARPSGTVTGAPLLFLHGAFAGAWMWSEILLPALARRGRACFAVSLRGHGGSEGQESLRTAGLDDYVADVRRAFAELTEPPVVVAHSLGGLIAQSLIGREKMSGLALLASLPPEGMFFTSPRLAMTDPVIFAEAFLATLGDAKLPIVAAAQKLLFSEGLPRERVARYASLMTPEAPRALAAAHTPGPVLSAFLFRIPTLVLGGHLDRLVWRASTSRTALYHGGEHHSLDDVGHFMPLDRGVDGVARLLVDWLDRKGI